MKKNLLILLGVLMVLPVFSQGYEPRDTWPFIYEDFLPGAVRSLDGTLVSEGEYNVAVHDGTLMYVGEDDVIMRPEMSRVYTARIGEDVYLNVMGRMYRILSELDCGVILLGAGIDVDKQNSVKIGYGISSSTASAYGLTNMMDGRFDVSGKKIQQSELDKMRGEILPVKQTTYLKIGLDLIPASRQEILNLPGIDRKTANAFFKQEKIKWQETASLEKVLVFVNEQLNK